VLAAADVVADVKFLPLLSCTAAALHHRIVALLGIEADVCNDNVAKAPMWRRTTTCAASVVV
jgi:hypothetical protein